MPVNGIKQAIERRSEGKAVPQVAFSDQPAQESGLAYKTKNFGEEESPRLMNSRQSAQGSGLTIGLTNNINKTLIRGGAPPVAPIEENIPLLRKYLVDLFKDVFDKNKAPFPAMKGKDLHIHLKEADVEPYAVHTPLPSRFTFRRLFWNC